MLSYYVDEFELWNEDTQINLDETDITYPKGGNKFKKSPSSSTTQWINPENGITCLYEIFIK